MPTIITKKLLGQRLPASTNKAFIYQAPANSVVDLETLVIANITGSSAAYTVYYNPNSNTPLGDEQLLYKSSALAANTTTKIIFDPHIYIKDEGGTLAVESETASALNFQ